MCEIVYKPWGNWKIGNISVILFRGIAWEAKIAESSFMNFLIGCKNSVALPGQLAGQTRR